MEPVNSRSLKSVDLLEGARTVMPPFAALRAFEVFGRVAGVRRSAQVLGLDHAVISRHLRSLEAWAGVPLVNRAHDGAHMTAEGAAYHRRISAALKEINLATMDLTRRGDNARLNLWCVPGFAFEWLTPRLHAFQAANPTLEFELRPTDAGPDFERHEADADIRYVRDALAARTASGVRHFEIARPEVIAVAAPSLLAQSPIPETPAQLRDAPLLHEGDYLEWSDWFEAQGVGLERQLAGPRLWHAHLTIDAARRGEGVALANAFLLKDDLATGRLVWIGRAAPAFRPVTLGAYVFEARADRWQSPAILKFRQWLSGLSDTERKCA